MVEEQRGERSQDGNIAMATYVDSISLLPGPCDAEGISVLRHLLIRHGLTFLSETNVVFNDHQGQEREPEVVNSEGEALNLIESWPALGGTQYSLRNHVFVLFLYGTDDYKADAIATSVSSSAYMLQPEFKMAYHDLLTDIHASFHANRTIVDHELLSPDSFWKEEFLRVKNGVFVGEYLIDLR